LNIAHDAALQAAAAAWWLPDTEPETMVNITG
jgi:hypothetical protein